jgi:hypothetical protein
MGIIERLLSRVKVNEETGCWEWQGARSNVGYGKMTVVCSGKKTNKLTHRLSYEQFRGEIPAGMCVLHRCDVPYCINPDHLFLGTYEDNSRDMRNKGREASGDRNGARLHPEQMTRGDKHWSRLHPERVRRGERHCQAKLSENDVLTIRRRWSREGATMKRMSKEYGVTDVTIGNVISRKTWKHV